MASLGCHLLLGSFLDNLIKKFTIFSSLFFTGTTYIQMEGPRASTSKQNIRLLGLKYNCRSYSASQNE